MDERELLKKTAEYEMGISFLRGLFDSGKLKAEEYNKASQYVSERYDIENVKMELVISKVG